jgi:hypothetical protein
MLGDATLSNLPESFRRKVEAVLRIWQFGVQASRRLTEQNAPDPSSFRLAIPDLRGANDLPFFGLLNENNDA